MFALNIPSTFGDTIDCRINGKPKRVTWRDEHTLVIEADPYATAPVDTDKFGANWTGLAALARQLRGDCMAGGISTRANVVVEFKNHPNRSSNKIALLPGH
jgi:hypothetical protein